MRSLSLWIAALWWGSLTTLGTFVVPMLFIKLPNPAMAGAMAAHLFFVQTMVSTVCGLGLLLLLKVKRPPALTEQAQAATLFIAIGVLLALLVEFGVAPKIVARENLVWWHRVGSVMYLAQWLCSAVVFGKLGRAASAKA